jgi:hypothetical protein
VFTEDYLIFIARKNDPGEKVCAITTNLQQIRAATDPGERLGSVEFYGTFPVKSLRATKAAD